MPITLQHPPIQAPPPQEGASPIQPNANNPFAVSPLWGMLWQFVQQAMQQYDPAWARPPPHEWGSAPVGEGPISSMAEGRYPSEGVTPVPFGHVSDPVSLLATLLAPVFQRGTQGVLSGVQTYRDLASAPQRIAAERAAWAEKTAAWDTEQAAFREALHQQQMQEITRDKAQSEAWKVWMHAHAPGTSAARAFHGATDADPAMVREALGQLIRQRGWQAASPAPGASPEPIQIQPGPSSIEDIIREVILKSQTNWRP